jgi:hypothetical protein
MDSRAPSIGRADPGRPEEQPEALAEAVTGIRAAAVVAIPEQGEFSGHRQMATPARREIRLKLAHGVGGEGQHARLVKLALPDEDRAVTRVVVADRQAKKFPRRRPSCRAGRGPAETRRAGAVSQGCAPASGSRAGAGRSPLPDVPTPAGPDAPADPDTPRPPPYHQTAPPTRRSLTP